MSAAYTVPSAEVSPRATRAGSGSGSRKGWHVGLSGAGRQAATDERVADGQAGTPASTHRSERLLRLLGLVEAAAALSCLATPLVAGRSLRCASSRGLRASGGCALASLAQGRRPAPHRPAQNPLLSTRLSADPLLFVYPQQIAVPETLLKKRKSTDKTREDKLAKAAEAKKVRRPSCPRSLVSSG